jgi:hypothetical protein
VLKRVHYGATSLKDAGSIPGGVIEIFQGLISSGLTVALGSTQPLKEMIIRNIFREGGKCLLNMSFCLYTVIYFPNIQADC